MAFKYALGNNNYEDFASGRVLYNQRGTTAFPVRLASEIFLRCVSLLQKDGINGPYHIYDPLCGGAYLLTALAFLHGESIKRIYASDIDQNAVKLAERNLSLLYEPGISARIRQLEQMITEFQKPSHAEALQSAVRLKMRVEELAWEVKPVCFVADVTKKGSLDRILDPIDMVITDLPYGDIVQWEKSAGRPGISGCNPGHEYDLKQAASPSEPEVRYMLDNLMGVLNQKAIVAIISREKLGAVHNGYRRADHFKHGKRHISVLRLNTASTAAKQGNQHMVDKSRPIG